MSLSAAQLLAVGALMLLLPVICVVLVTLLAWPETHGKVNSGRKH